ncbi:MAG: protein-L-isoaspartate O-methyltransferase family protein, partial [Blastocatellia bacterium]
ATLEEVRSFYSDEIKAVANVRTPALVDAFAKVPREHFLGPGPWKVWHSGITATGGSYHDTEDDDPKRLYHNILLAIDAERGLNNGQPSALAVWIDALDLKSGETVAHLGCGVGYYTAIMAETVGPAGLVSGIEVDPGLSSIAKSRVRYLSNVQVITASAADYDTGAVDAILVNAGVTHLRTDWLDSLRPGGRLVVPLTFSPDPNGVGSGFMLRVERIDGHFAARFIGPVAIYPCLGLRTDTMNQQVRDLLMRGGYSRVQSLRRQAHEREDSCQFHSDEFCLSANPVEA